MGGEQACIKELTPETLVSALKEKIINKCVLDKSNLPQFIYSNLTLDEKHDSDTLDDVGIEDLSKIYLVHRVKGGKMIELVVQIAVSIKEELKLDFDDTKTVKDLKNLIASRNSNLKSNDMGLQFAGVTLLDSKALNFFNVPSGSLILQTKGNLREHGGLLLSFEPDMLYFNSEEGVPNAKMPCGHVISTESMTQFLRSLLTAR